MKEWTRLHTHPLLKIRSSAACSHQQVCHCRLTSLLLMQRPKHRCLRVCDPVYPIFPSLPRMCQEAVREKPLICDWWPKVTKWIWCKTVYCPISTLSRPLQAVGRLHLAQACRGRTRCRWIAKWCKCNRRLLDEEQMHLREASKDKEGWKKMKRRTWSSDCW